MALSIFLIIWNGKKIIFVNVINIKQLYIVLKLMIIIFYLFTLALILVVHVYIIHLRYRVFSFVFQAALIYNNTYIFSKHLGASKK